MLPEIREYEKKGVWQNNLDAIVQEWISNKEQEQNELFKEDQESDEEQLTNELDCATRQE